MNNTDTDSFIDAPPWFVAPERSPLAFRSGLPFGAADASGGDAGFSMPRPATLAGGMRAAWADGSGFLAGHVHDPERHRGLVEGLSVAGPMLVEVDDAGWMQPLSPVPADAVLHDHVSKVRRWHALAPRAPLDGGSGCNMPDGLWPVVDRMDPDDAADQAPAHWRWSALVDWLTHDRPPVVLPKDGQGRPGMALSVRTHIQQDPDRGTALDGALFESPALDGKPTDWWVGPQSRAPRLRRALAAQLSVDRAGPGMAAGEAALDRVVCTLGAEGRSVRWRQVGGGGGGPHYRWFGDPPNRCPERITQMLKAAKKADLMRMMLVTPAAFLHGARPGFLAEAVDGRWQGRLPAGGPRVELVAAALGRWGAHSGVAMQRDRGSRGERATRRVAAAGSVYWLRLLEDWPAGCDPAALWWCSVADVPQDERDGWARVVFGRGYADASDVKEE